MAVSDIGDADLATVIDGRKIADELIETVKLEAEKLKSSKKILSVGKLFLPALIKRNS